ERVEHADKQRALLHVLPFLRVGRADLQHDVGAQRLRAVGQCGAGLLVGFVEKMCLGSRAAFYDDGMLGRDEFLYRLWGCGHARLARRAFTWDSNMHVVSSASLWFLLMLLLKLLYSKSLCQVGQDVANMLQAHAKPDHIFAHAGGGQLFGTKLTVCGGSGVAGQRF